MIVVDSCELVVDGIYSFREALYNESTMSQFMQF